LQPIANTSKHTEQSKRISLIAQELKPQAQVAPLKVLQGWGKKRSLSNANSGVESTKQTRALNWKTVSVANLF
jgi:hypothetical protein